MKKLLTIIALVFLSLNLTAGVGELLPAVKRIVVGRGEFKMEQVRLSTPCWERQWRDFVEESGATIDPQAKFAIEIALVSSIQGVEQNRREAYNLRVSKGGIRVEAIDSVGVFWALQTLRQLRSGRTGFACVDITDYPAFAVRGFMQDVGRSYISIEELKREIAKLSEYKINTFHWHLTENQAWRLESKVFPMLNDSVNMTRMEGKYYTIEQARDLVAFCKAHNVRLIPEIDIPGHSEAFVRTFRHDMQSKEGMKILKLLLEEVCETFSEVEYIHLGTDEVRFTNAQFVPQMVAFVRSFGKKVISWNPGWKYNVGEIDMEQMWSYRGKPHEGIPAIDSRFHYLNHFDAFADIIALHNSTIYHKTRSDEQIAGTILALWHDRYIPEEESIIVQNHLYPNMLAIAERSWVGGGVQYFDKSGTNLTDELLPAFSEFEKRMIWHKRNNFAGYPFAYIAQSDARWTITDAFPNNGDLAMVFPPEEKIANSYRWQGKEYGTSKANGSGVYLRHVWGETIPGFYKDPQPNHTAYAYTWVYSPVNQRVGLWFTSQNYSRSEKDLAPPQGEWDYKKSRIWINNQPIAPPVWSNSHTELSNEIPLGNENFEAREPLPVHLNRGWNKVMIKLPIGGFKMEQTRLNKWMFNAAFVTLDGRDSVEGLKYSTTVR